MSGNLNSRNLYPSKTTGKCICTSQLFTPLYSTNVCQGHMHEVDNIQVQLTSDHTSILSSQLPTVVCTVVLQTNHNVIQTIGS